ISQSHALAAMEQSPHRALGNSHLARQIRVEPSEPRLFDNRITERHATDSVIDWKWNDAVFLSLHGRFGSDLAILHRKAFFFAADLDCPSQQGFRARRSPQSHWLLASLKGESTKQSDDAEHVVGVHVSEEDV